jgi:hypothetical protein
MTTIAIHQPNYLPYLGFFDKMVKSEIFVIHDDVQFNKRDFQQRNKIRTFEGWKWLSVPIKKESKPISEINIINEKQKNKPHWFESHFRDIRANYVDTEFFNLYEKQLEQIYNRDCEKLIDLNMSLIKFLIKAFDIEVELLYASEFGFESTSTQKIIDIVNALDGDSYLSGTGGYNYLDTSLFGDVTVTFQDFQHPVYRQRYDGFIPNMSAIDALFNVGEIPKSE